MEKNIQGTHSLSHSGEYRESCKPEKSPLKLQEAKGTKDLHNKAKNRTGRKRTYKRQTVVRTKGIKLGINTAIIHTKGRSLYEL